MTQSSFGNLKKAVLEACRKEKAIDELDNFGAGWDFSRFVFLVEHFGKDSLTWPKYDSIFQHLKRCLEGRNMGAHECHSQKTEDVYSNDVELNLLVQSAKTYIPQINSNRKESAKIRKKLRELEELLAPDDDS